MPNYVRYEPEHGYVKVAVSKRKRRSDAAVGYVSAALALLLVGGFAVAVLVGWAGAVYRFFGG